jgi:flagellar basal body-associated protein FliL
MDPDSQEPDTPDDDEEEKKKQMKTIWIIVISLVVAILLGLSLFALWYFFIRDRGQIFYGSGPPEGRENPDA